MRIHRRLFYIVGVVGLAAIVAGLATGVINLSRQNQSAIVNETSYSGTVVGLKYTSTVAGKVPSPAPVASSGTASVPQLLISGGNVFCGTTCTASHVALNVTYAFNTSMAGSISIAVQVTASGGGGSTTLYLRQPAVATSGTIVIVWDAGTSAGGLTSVTLTIHQCSGSSCP